MTASAVAEGSRSAWGSAANARTCTRGEHSCVGGTYSMVAATDYIRSHVVGTTITCPTTSTLYVQSDITNE